MAMINLKFFMIITFTLLASIQEFKGPIQNIELNKINKAFEVNDVSALAKYFYNSVQISLPDVNSTLSKSQAKRIIDQFFNDYSCIEISVVKSDRISAGNWFSILNYISKSNKFKIYYRIQTINEQHFIREIQILEI